MGMGEKVVSILLSLKLIFSWAGLKNLSYEKKVELHSTFCSLFKGLSREKIESVFGHFTKFNNRKTNSSQNSLPKKRTLQKIHYQRNGLFTKFITKKADCSQISMSEKQTLFTKFNEQAWKFHFLRIPLFFF